MQKEYAKPIRELINLTPVSGRFVKNVAKVNLIF